ncbi:MAG: FAD-binding protein [Candidatus Lokiarchaeota archaeon]|nr:FAD-binding protein [Candidatus Lokiarchaeota archaeon]
MNSQQLIKDLEAICSDFEIDPNVLKKSMNLEFFSEYISQVSTDKFQYDAILKPKDYSEIKKIIQYANEKEIPIIPKGGGNSLAGQLFPSNGGFLLDLSKFNKIEEINFADRYAIVECGVTIEQLIPLLMKNGFYFPPSFNNYKKLTIGGLIGNNVSNSYRFYTSNYILGLEIILSNGDIINTGSKTLKNVSGYNISSLFIGSEGSLGVVLKAILKIDPIPTNLRIIMLDSPQITTLIDWFQDNWKEQEINYIKIIQENLKEKHTYQLIIETIDQKIENLKTKLTNLQLLKTFEIYSYSDFQENIYSNTFKELIKEKPLIFGFKTFIGNTNKFLIEIEKYIDTFQLNLKLDITIINQTSYFVLIISHHTIDDMKKIIKMRLKLLDTIKTLGDGLIPDFGLSLWNQMLFDDDQKLQHNYKDQIKSVFDPKNILNPKNYSSKETKILVDLIENI